MLIYNPLSFKIDEAIEHAKKEWPNESCGYIRNNEYIVCQNMSNDKENCFLISNKKFDDAYLSGEIQAIIHSHNSRASASSIDQMKCDEMEIPFGIINLIDPDLITHCIFWGKEIPVAPYINRPFFFGVFDCLSLVCDYYKQKYKIKLPSPFRDVEFISNNYRFFEEYIEGLTQFRVIELDELEEDDILFYSYTGRIIHVGIYINEDKCLHHWLNQKSGYYPLSYKKNLLQFGFRRKQ